MKNKKNNSNNIIIFGIIVVVILVLLVFLIKGCTNKDSNENDEDEIVEKKGSSEEDIKEAYGMSGEDAIDVVKQLYNGDVYEFNYSINNDSKYVVTVKNLVTESKTNYIVDPISKSYYQSSD